MLALRLVNKEIKEKVDAIPISSENMQSSKSTFKEIIEIIKQEKEESIKAQRKLFKTPEKDWFGFAPCCGENPAYLYFHSKATATASLNGALIGTLVGAIAAVSSVGNAPISLIISLPFVGGCGGTVLAASIKNTFYKPAELASEETPVRKAEAPTEETPLLEAEAPKMRFMLR